LLTDYTCDRACTILSIYLTPEARRRVSAPDTPELNSDNTNARLASKLPSRCIFVRIFSTRCLLHPLPSPAASLLTRFRRSQSLAAASTKCYSVVSSSPPPGLHPAPSRIPRSPIPRPRIHRCVIPRISLAMPLPPTSHRAPRPFAPHHSSFEGSETPRAR